MRVLLIGSLPPPAGGTQVSFQLLIRELQATVGSECVLVSDTSKIRGRGVLGLLRLLRVTYTVFVQARKVDVVTLHIASTALSSWGIIVLCLSRLARKPLIVRKFGGLDHRSLGWLRGRLAELVIRRSDLFLAQTQHLVRLSQIRGITHVRWFPTSRPGPNTGPIEHSPTCTRFVFIGQVREHKGITELIAAAERFAEGVIVDVYGPIFCDLDARVFDDCRIARYRGELLPGDVPATLLKYDASLLPTKAMSEGYPGAIPESYIAGIPIITTRCGAIPEIVSPSSGILIDPGDSAQLYEAMLRLVQDREYYARLCDGALQMHKQFTLELWLPRFLEYCRRVSGNRHHYRVSTP